MSDFKTKYSVDTVPWYWWLPMQCYGWIAGVVMFLYFGFVAVTSRVSHEGHPLDPNSNYIFCFWHQSLLTYLSLSVRFNTLSLLIHPAWYMIPSHRASRLKGAKNLVLGSSGNAGKAAAAKLCEYIKHGHNTFFTPDGPYGPHRTLHKGAIFVSINSSTPLVGMTISPSRYLTLSGWDSKHFPLPFNHFTLRYGAPILASQTTLADVSARLVEDMG